MEALIPINKSEGGKDVVSARRLHHYLEVPTKFTDWWARKLAEYPCFEENVDFCSILSESTGGRQATDYVITLDMAKELSMTEKNEQGRKARRYFIECEKQLRAVVEAPRPALPTTYKEALTALLAEVEQKERLEQELALAAPAIAFTQAVSDSKDLVSVGEFAKTLNIKGVGRTIMFRWLRRDGYLISDGSNLPYQKHIDAGLFTVKQRVLAQRSEQNNLQAQTMITGKGVRVLTERYLPQAQAA
ncbi:phage antirepressor KilAC domain-containing protein [Hymenobacter coalescens]